MNAPAYKEYLEGDDPEQDIQELNSIPNKKQMYSNPTALMKSKKIVDESY